MPEWARGGDDFNWYPWWQLPLKRVLVACLAYVGVVGIVEQFQVVTYSHVVFFLFMFVCFCFGGS